MTGVRESKKRRTRKAILDAAVSLFGAKGFDGTSMEELARAAGVGKSTIYGYFRTKEDIFLAFCEEEVDFALGELAQKSDPEASLTDRLATLFMSQFRFVTANRPFGRHLMREVYFPKGGCAEASRELNQRYMGAIGEILERARSRGELRSDCDLFLASGHFCAIYLIALSSFYMGHVRTDEEVETGLRLLMRQAMTGLAGEGSKAPAPPTLSETTILESVKHRWAEPRNDSHAG